MSEIKKTIETLFSIEGTINVKEDNTFTIFTRTSKSDGDGDSVSADTHIIMTLIAAMKSSVAVKSIIFIAASKYVMEEQADFEQRFQEQQFLKRKPKAEA